MAQLIPCPDCQKHLQVPDDLLGKLVQCPECKQTFTARLPEKVSPAPWQSSESKPPAIKRTRNEDDDRDEDDRDRSRRSVRRNLSPHRGEMILIFGLLSLFFPMFSIVFALLAWIMGGADLREMREGRMDQTGEGLTQAGRIMGMVSVGLHLLGIVVCCGFYGFIFIVGVAGVGAGVRQNQQRQFR